MRHTNRFVRMYVTKCHRERTAGSGSLNFGKHSYVDKVSLFANFHPNRQRLRPHCQGRRFESSTLRRSYVNISQTMTDEKNVIIANKKKVYVDFLLAYLHLFLARSKGQGQGHAHWHCEYLANGIDKSNINIPINEVACGLSMSLFRFDFGLL